MKVIVTTKNLDFVIFKGSHKIILIKILEILIFFAAYKNFDYQNIFSIFIKSKNENEK